VVGTVTATAVGLALGDGDGVGVGCGVGGGTADEYLDRTLRVHRGDRIGVLLATDVEHGRVLRWGEKRQEPFELVHERAERGLRPRRT